MNSASPLQLLTSRSPLRLYAEHLIDRSTVWCCDGAEGLWALPAECASLVVLDPPSRVGLDDDDDENETTVAHTLDSQHAAIRRFVPAVRHALKPGGACVLLADNLTTISAWDMACARASTHDSLQPQGAITVVWENPSEGLLTRLGRVARVAMRRTRNNDHNDHIVNSLPSTSHIRWHTRPNFRHSYRHVHLDSAAKCADLVAVKRLPHVRQRTPQQRPLELYDYLVSMFSNRGELVVDPMCGAGTALVAAWRHWREWVGFDHDASMSLVAKSRAVGSAYGEWDDWNHVGTLHEWRGGKWRPWSSVTRNPNQLDH